MGALVTHIAYVLAYADCLLGFHVRQVEAKDQWGAYIAKQKAVADLCQVVKGGNQRTFVAFGAVRGGHIRGLPPGPMKLVQAALVRYVRGSPSVFALPV